MTNKLTLHVTDRGEGPIFERFFEAYDRAFVLPDEKETRDGLATCLALNHGAARDKLFTRYGEFREVCVIATDGPDGDFIGGANLIAMPLPASCGVAETVTANLNYIFIDEAARGKGHMRALLDALKQMLGGFFPAAGGGQRQVLIFIEQNDPFVMTPDAYAHDTAFTGMDQFDRLRIWTRQGARVLNFAYTQPPLSDDQQAEPGLVYSVLGATEDNLPAALLIQHLRSFFGISVLKGEPLAQNPAAQSQLDQLAGGDQNICLLDASAALAAIEGDPVAFVAHSDCDSFRAWILRHQSLTSMVS